MNSTVRRKLRRTNRKGATAVEFAFVAPVVFLVLLALIQFASLSMSQNLLTSAAREGGRVAAMPSTVSSSTVVAAVEDRLQRGGIDPNLATVNVNPTALGNLSTGQELTITVLVPLRDMAWMWAIAPPNANVSTVITCERE